jgi:hypothetical protein
LLFSIGTPLSSGIGIGGVWKKFWTPPFLFVIQPKEMPMAMELLLARYPIVTTDRPSQRFNIKEVNENERRHS